MFQITIYQVQCALFYIENDAEIFPAHYTWKVTDKGFKMAFMMNKLAMNNKNYYFCPKLLLNTVRTILVWALYSIKYGNSNIFALKKLTG